MKKYLALAVLSIVSFLGINSVSAGTYTDIDKFYNNFDKTITYYNTYKSNIDELVSRWEVNYKTSYPYYLIHVDFNTLDTPNVYLIASPYNQTEWDNAELSLNTLYGVDYLQITYSPDTNTYKESIHPTGNEVPYFPVYNFTFAGAPFLGLLYNHGFLYNNNPSVTDSLTFPSFTSSDFDFSIDSFTIYEDYYLPSYLQLYNDNYIPSSTFTEINLNNYSYVALSLKDYTEREAFHTNVYVKGNYCITPVYNYGMTEKSEYYSGYQVDRCSPYYENYTSIRTYILEQDIKNYAIYYLKAYNTSKENIIKIDNSVFNITYITEENKNNPYVSINGKNYPAISYDSLSSSATKSESEGYISGGSCQVGDFNCYVENNPENIFDSIFSKPLEFLEGIWDSVSIIFDIIIEFISLLPNTMQSFLYLSFMIAIILGLLKLIL